MSSTNDSIHSVKILPTKKRDEFIDFWSWLSSSAGVKPRTAKVAALPTVAAIIGIVYYLLAIGRNLIEQGVLTSNSFKIPQLNDAIRSSYGVQIFVIVGILLLYALRVEEPDCSQFEYGREGQKRLRFWWLVALLSFLFLYICLWVRAAIHQVPENVTLFSLLGILSNLCNNLSTFAFLMCFSTMEWPVNRCGNRNERWALVWVVCLVSLTFLEAAFTFTYPEAIRRWQTNWFALLTGANAGIALAMFCGRLSSPLISPSLSVMVPLYFYAILQMSFGFWEKEPSVAFVMANFALILKCFLSLVIAWLLTTRNLVFYLERVHKTRSELEKWRDEFRERALLPAKEQETA